MIFQATLTLAFSSSNLLNDSSNDCVKYNAYIYIEREYYIPFSILNISSARDNNVSQRVEGQKAGIGRRLIHDLIWKKVCIVIFINT